VFQRYSISGGKALVVTLNRTCIFILLLTCCLVIPAHGRSLYWLDLTVTARLADDGRLHVREQQTIVFDGDWNGGERIFDIRSGQSFVFEAIYRQAPDGAQIALSRGNLARVDHYDWTNNDTLRWRSRLPGEKPFSNQAITYTLVYTLANILEQRDGEYVLAHDFAFPQRSGVIERFQLDLELGPGWQQSGFPLREIRKNIPPGQSVVVTRTLQHLDGHGVLTFQGADGYSPLPTTTAAPRWFAFTVTALLLALLAARSSDFYRHEKRLGRFLPLPAPDKIDASWLQEHVFPLPPETVGATWDRRTSGHEVAAILARLVVEQKLDSRLEPVIFPIFNWRIPGQYTLHLTLRQPREQFRGYERELIDGFFIDGDATDTRRIRAHYRKKNQSFSPEQKIKEPLQKKVDRLTRAARNPLEHHWLKIVAAMAVSFFLLLINAFLHQDEVPVILLGGFAGLFAVIIGSVTGDACRRRSDWLVGRTIIIHLIPLLLTATFLLLVLSGISAQLVSALAILCGSGIYASLHFAKTRDSRKGVALSRNLTAARTYLARELRKENPALRDEWFPYLLAFGLGPFIDTWSRRYGGGSRHTSVSLSGSAAAPFTGGGGRFGGGGASGAWAAAATSLGRSTSSSSGSSGGGSSGGGGGGGW
jgi:uncharacterized membrane protein YgcG